MPEDSNPPEVNMTNVSDRQQIHVASPLSTSENGEPTFQSETTDVFHQ